MRSIANANYHSHTVPLTKLKLLDIFAITSFHIAKFMIFFHHHLLCSSFLSLFTTNNLIHSFNTRTATDHRPHACRANVKDPKPGTLYLKMFVFSREIVQLSSQPINQMMFSVPQIYSKYVRKLPSYEPGGSPPSTHLFTDYCVTLVRYFSFL